MALNKIQCALIGKRYRAGNMSERSAKEKSRPPTGVATTSRPSTVSQKTKAKRDNVDLKSKEEEYRFFASSGCALVIDNEPLIDVLMRN